MYNNFILNFSPFINDPTPPKLLEYIKSHSYTYQYLVPFTGTVIIKATAPLGALIESYINFLKPNHFIITHVNPAFVNGYLQGQYWEWLNSSNPPALTDQR